MITIKEAPNQTFKNKGELISFLKEKREELKSLKKNEPIKYTDGISIATELINGKKSSNKNETNKNEGADLLVKIVLNTTNYLDSHSDVHIKGIWKRTLKQTKTHYHLQEHKRDFDKVISTDIKAYVEEIPFKDLGVNSTIKTEALIFESRISKERNPDMYKQYKNGWVKNHSVGMQYVDIELAIFDEEDEKEMDFWNKYIQEIANKEEAEEEGFFWVVKEAKLKEGSAVLFGSNPITPTLEVEETKGQSSNDTDSDKGDPSKDTQRKLIMTNLI